MANTYYAAQPQGLLDLVIVVNEHPVEVMVLGLCLGDSFVFQKQFGPDGTCWVDYRPCGQCCTAIDPDNNPVIMQVPGRYRLVPLRGMNLEGMMVMQAEISMAQPIGSNCR
jgi:hypothetical protein